MFGSVLFSFPDASSWNIIVFSPLSLGAGADVLQDHGLLPAGGDPQPGSGSQKEGGKNVGKPPAGSLWPSAPIVWRDCKVSPPTFFYRIGSRNALRNYAP